MTKEEINKLAFVGGSIPDGLNCAERCLYLTLKELYRQFKAGDISKDSGEKQKNEAMRRYAQDVEALAFADKIIRNHANMWKAIEYTASVYRREKTIAAADAFIEAVYRNNYKECDTPSE